MPDAATGRSEPHAPGGRGGGRRRVARDVSTAGPSMPCSRGGAITNRRRYCCSAALLLDMDPELLTWRVRSWGVGLAFDAVPDGQVGVGVAGSGLGELYPRLLAAVAAAALRTSLQLWLD